LTFFSKKCKKQGVLGCFDNILPTWLIIATDKKGIHMFSVSKISTISTLISNRNMTKDFSSINTLNV